MRRAKDAPEVPISEISLAGMSIGERQLDFALAFGCEQVICITHEDEDAYADLREQAEACGAEFTAISSARSLLGKVGTTDELVVIAEGLLLDAGIALDALSGRNGVLVLPVDTGIAAGFERIDLNYAWAGVLCMPGSLVERLTQLPPDCDAASALLRIALQAQVPERQLPESVVAQQKLALVGDASRVTEIGEQWQIANIPRPSIYAPGRSITSLAMRKMGASILAKGLKPSLFKGAGLTIAAAGCAASWFGVPVVGIAAGGLGWLAAQAGTALDRMMHVGIAEKPSSEGADFAIGWMFDVLLVAILTFALYGSWPDRLFVSVVMLAFLRLWENLAKGRWADLAHDRLLLAAILAVAAGFDVTRTVIQVICAGLILVLLGVVGAQSRLTST